MTAESGPLGGADVAATVQGGPVGTAQTTFTVTGSLLFTADNEFGNDYISENMFDLNLQQFGNTAATGPTELVDPPGPYGNSGPTGPNDVPIKDQVEFGVDCYVDGQVITRFGRPFPRVQVLVDVTPTGAITITRKTLLGTPEVFATITLTSPLFVGATDVQSVLTLESVPDRFALEDATNKDTKAAAAAAKLKSKSVTAKPASAQAVRPAQDFGNINPEIIDAAAGTIKFELGSDDDFGSNWPGFNPADIQGSRQFEPSDSQTFQVELAPALCADGGVCCANGVPKTSGVCRNATLGSCKLDGVYDGTTADCPASRNKLDHVPCLWHPSRSYPMGDYVDADDAKVMSASAQDAKVMAVSAYDAAAWLTGQPAYETEWPACKGVCYSGMCALRMDHPACCFVRPHGGYGYKSGHGEPYGDASEDEYTVSVSSFGYWRSRDWYCWKN